ncbi:hypothetical protein FLK61_41110 [Paenalkalicoccus suaedae]|uniref:Tryptophan-rich sensory protein n=1 Tax=Paenalkalicoccus suaedae TaxID=2592382 RepID=A0A859FJL9_9BACI|nr:hypothetical protein [Paenalkalicoccus suaedae]QKS72997.1 hypothetical protein FLK61_41110 [Paenalkalicoccus suaedae]
MRIIQWLRKKWKRLAVLLLAIFQPVSVILVERGGNELFSGEGTDPFIIPAGYAFSIWSLIVLGTIAYGIYQLLPRTYSKNIYDDIALPAIAVFSGFALWIWSASNEWLAATVLIFIAMGVVLRTISLKLKQEPLSKLEKGIVRFSFSCYYGWTTVAIFANTASALHYYGLPNDGVLGIAWQALILVGATLTSSALLREMPRNITYFATIMWAFIAIVIGTVLVGTEAILLTMLAVAATAYLIVTWRGRRKYSSQTKFAY